MTSTTEAFIVHAFTDNGGGGNPAGVVLDADDLGTEARLAIARTIGLSETAFVSRSATETVRLEFFTPTRQIAHCGHATVATFALLRQLDRIGDGVLSKETIDGRREVVVDGDMVWMEQRAPRYQTIDADSPLAARIAASLGSPAPPPTTVVDTGNRFAVIECGSVASLAGLAPDSAAIHRVSEELDLVGYYVFARTGTPPGRVATTRMFGPRFSIEEEAATGMAAGPLACLLHRMEGLGPELMIGQGAFMTPPSSSELRVKLDIDDGQITRLFAGGTSRLARSLSVAVDDLVPGGGAP